MRRHRGCCLLVPPTRARRRARRVAVRPAPLSRLLEMTLYPGCGEAVDDILAWRAGLPVRELA